MLNTIFVKFSHWMKISDKIAIVYKKILNGKVECLFTKKECILSDRILPW